LIGALYGQARGYRRLDVRRRVAANERLAPDALARLTAEGFQLQVHRSIERFPFYAQRVRAHRGSLPRQGEHVRPEELPIWTRDDQRAFFAQQERPHDSEYVRQTSGSTGQPIRFHVTRESYEWRTSVTDRNYSWAHAEEGVRALHLWPAERTPATRGQRVKRAVHLVLQRRVYFDAFQQFTDKERAECCALINRIKPDCIVGYAGMLVDIARYARDHRALTWKPATMVSAAEGLQSGQRELLEQNLVGEVFLSYGSREFMSIGMECKEHNGYHLATDNVFVEVVDDAGMPLPPGKEGRIVITDFHNAANPFVRYEIGDVGVMAPEESCGCRRPFPRLLRVDGRSQDVIQTPRGAVTAIYITFTMRQFDDWIDGYQVVQNARNRVLIRLLTHHRLTAERLAPVTAMLREKLGDMTIDYERVDMLPRRASGKVDLVISTVGTEERSIPEAPNQPTETDRRLFHDSSHRPSPGRVHRAQRSKLETRMRPLTMISALYGEARGYNRLRIRRLVAANARVSREELLKIADAAFQHHVQRSIARFPFYAERVKEYRGSLPTPGRQVLPEELPVWTRDDQREFFAQQEHPADSHYVHQTSGSTGRLARFHITRESYEWRTAIMDRVYAWAGAEEGVRSIHIWGMGPKAPPLGQRAKNAIHRTLQRRVFYDVYREFTDVERQAICDLINRVKPLSLVGYAGQLSDIARFARDHGALTWKAATLISTAEGLQGGQRELMQAHLADEVFDSYGTREFMNIGTECEMHRGYHLTSDNLLTEVVDPMGQPSPPGEAGRIVITDFHNAATPFIRYEVGDIGTMAPADEICACGRPFPLLGSIEGRDQELIYGPNGPISALFVNYAVRGFSWVDGYQVVQRSRDHILIRLLTRAELTSERVGVITDILRKRLGDDVAIDYERVDELERRPNGKVAVVISTVADAA
jgi:phenylacetate-CoA ligase